MAGKLASTSATPAPSSTPPNGGWPTPRRLRSSQDSSNFDLSMHLAASSSSSSSPVPNKDIFMKDLLLPHFKRLCRESENGVRTHVAALFHEFAQSLKNDAPLIIDSFIDLSYSGDVEVINLLATHLEETLECIYGRRGGGAPAGVEEKKDSASSMHNGTSSVTKNGNATFCPQFHPAHNRMVRSLVSCNTLVRKSTHWRTHEQLLSSFSCLSRFLSNDELCQIFVPLIQEEIFTARALPCRLAALRTLIKWAGDMNSVRDTIFIIDFCKHRLAQNKSCHKRVLFLDACEISIELISMQFFKSHFFTPALILAHDPVLNVRMKLCKMIPMFRSHMALPMDSSYVLDLENALKTMLNTGPTGSMAEIIDKALDELSEYDKPPSSSPPLPPGVPPQASSPNPLTLKDGNINNASNNASVSSKYPAKNGTPTAPLPSRTFPAVLRAMSAIKDGLTPGQHKQKSAVEDHDRKQFGTSTKSTNSEDTNGEILHSAPSPYAASKMANGYSSPMTNGHTSLLNGHHSPLISGQNGNSNGRSKLSELLAFKPSNKKVAVIYPRQLISRTPSPRPKSQPAAFECEKCADVNGNIPIADIVYSTPSVASLNGVSSVKSSAIDSKLRRLWSKPSFTHSPALEPKHHGIIAHGGGRIERIVPIQLVATRSLLDYDWDSVRPPTPATFRRLSVNTASLPRSSTTIDNGPVVNTASAGSGTMSRVRNIPVLRTGVVMKSVEKLEAGL